MYYLIYKTTNMINGKIYIGKHQTKNKNDDYLGSGVYLNKAIKKYGRLFFVYLILFLCLSRTEMDLKLRLIITPLFLKENNTYNLNVGGWGGWHYTNASGKNIHHIGVPCSELKKLKISLSNKGKKQSELVIRNRAQKNTGKKMTELQRKHISDGLIGKKKSQEHIDNLKIARKNRTEERQSLINKKMALINLGRIRSLLEKLKRSIKMKEYWMMKKQSGTSINAS